jgi:predicted nuclease of predicted toxin-antitoxin system
LILWLDAHLSPDLAPWIQKQFDIETHAVRDLDLKNAKDEQIFMAARQAGAVVMSKDSDFRVLLDRLGHPPQLLWLTCGNTSNVRLKETSKQDSRRRCAGSKRVNGLLRSATPLQPLVAASPGTVFGTGTGSKSP